MVSLKHKFHSGKTDSSDASIVRPTNWNEEHDHTMGSNKLLGRSLAGTGPVGEMGLSNKLQFTGSDLDLSDSHMSDFNGKANKATLVMEQDEITGSLDGATYMVIGGGKNGRVLLSDLKTKGNVADSRTKVIAGPGLSHGLGGQDTLASDIEIHLAMPETLTGTTENDQQVGGGGHTHLINCLDVIRKGNADISAEAVGTYAFARQQGGSSAKVIGETISGANLFYASANGGGGLASNVGTWRCMGRVTGDTSANAPSNITLWMRIS